MNAASMARVFFNLQKRSLENFFDAWVTSQGLATQAVLIWGRQMGIGERGRGCGDRWQRIVLQEQDVSQKHAGDDTKGAIITSKAPTASQPASDMPPSDAPRWPPSRVVAVGRFGGRAHFPRSDGFRPQRP